MNTRTKTYLTMELSTLLLACSGAPPTALDFARVATPLDASADAPADALADAPLATIHIDAGLPPHVDGGPPTGVWNCTGYLAGTPDVACTCLPKGESLGYAPAELVDGGFPCPAPEANQCCRWGENGCRCFSGPHAQEQCDSIGGNVSTVGCR